VIWASKPSGLQFIDCATKLMEEGQRGTRVKTGLETGGDAMMGGARGTIAEVASETS
jgi:hypothetical protein